MNRRDRSPFGPPVREADGPVFAEPWHAQVLALAAALSNAGLFSPSDWSAALGAALRRAADHGAADDEDTYYRAALAALERLVDGAGALPPGDLSVRVEAWRRAYLNTPHGQPVHLSAGLADQP